MSETCLIKADTIDQMAEAPFVHPLNEKAVRQTRTLSEATGMTNLGVHLVRVEPGAETTEYHLHHCEEEFLYILSGTGTAEIDGEAFEVGAGDFLGFAARGPAHTMRNDGEEDLVYLMAGERRSGDLVDYPRAGKRLMKSAGKREFTDLPEGLRV